MSERDERLKGITVASGATSTASFTDIVQTQLFHWTRAEESYAALKLRDGHHWGDYKPILVDLGQSLKDLFGQNRLGTSSYTPPLIYFISNTFPKERDWNLKTDDPDLYDHFVEFDRVYNDYGNHPDAAKNPLLASELTFDKLTDLMDTTQRVWKWILEKRAGGHPVPKTQLKEFHYRFKEVSQ
jgi:hypothetical protein